ncbi:hypothetical protein [Polaribacter sp.]|uniref:hypothetical protein n=1 Tax=Polaribacter sp. TaxID=1920175 RepID=UPI003EF87EE5
MKKTVIIITLIWIGFVCSISFMEAWLKFQAPNITIPLGLGIGKLVFAALNRVEIFFSLVLFISFIINFKELESTETFTVSTIILTVLLQTLWLLPVLDERATLIIQNIQVPKSNLHFVIVFFEITKVACLLTFGNIQLNKLQTTNLKTSKPL